MTTKDPENLSSESVKDSINCGSELEEIYDENSSSKTQKEGIDKDEEVTQVKELPFFNTLMNLLNCLLGAGILSVPNSFNSAGIAVSIVFICFIAVLSYFASMINVKLNLKYQCQGFDELVEKIMGKGGSITYSIIVLFFNFASMLAYLIIGGDTIISWMAFAGIDISHFVYRLIMIFIYSILIPIPLMIPKNLFFLSIFSTAAIFMVIFYIVAVIVKTAQLIPQYGISPTVVVAKIDMSIFSAIGVYALTFALPCVVIPTLKPFSKDYTKRRNVVLTTFCICVFLTIFPSILMYLIFGQYADGNILNSFPSNDILFTIVRAGFFIIVSTSFPVLGKASMSNWSQLIYKQNHPNDLTNGKYFIVLFLSAIFPLVVAMLLPQCKPAVSVGGALGGCLVSFMFPSVLLIISNGDGFKNPINVLCLIFAIFGGAMAVISTYQSILEAIDAFKSAPM
ncbi:hypothetical protein M9Y10_003473 [Tritrichomonas musculus]|uniref:Amino acid transporter transmembrane domain-containing protein n=1 Tax=Tritrichomonas musculus TaxID=1915356 RepID=A0ABR2JPH0_9EUKA